MKSDKGFIPVMLTPFKDNGAVDYETLTRLTEFYIDAGAKGLFANCLSSEMFELTPAERIAVTSHVVKAARDKVPVVATGTFEGSSLQQAVFINEIYDTGIQAVILITSLMAAENEPDKMLADSFFKLLDQTGNIPLGFYECPVPYKRLIPPALLHQFIQTGRVTYHKDTSLDIAAVREKIQAGEGYDFGLYDAYIINAIDALKAGAAGLSCIQGNFFPELIVWLCENHDRADREQELNIVMRFLSDNMEIMHEVYPPVAKLCLQQRGFNIGTYTRRAVGHIDKQQLAGIQKLFNDYTLLENRLAIPCLL